MKVYPTSVYERAVRKLMTGEERRNMEAVIVAEPNAAPVIPGTGGIRKLRWALPGRGKRGGAQVIYFHRARPEELYLLTIYAKSDQEDLSPADRRAWAALVATIKEERS